MIYKFNNGGIVKLQNAGSVPEYGNIEQIAKYNHEHGTNFYKMSQVLEHDKQQAQQKSQNKKKSFWEILAGHPESAGEAILNKTIETANNVAEGSGGIQNLVNDVIIKGKRKSILGNNGNFDWNDEIIWRKQGGILKAQDGTFEDFWITLPQNQQDSTDFNVRRYWELNGKPINFKEAVKRGMYKKEKDGYHANSIAFNEETGEYEFMKSPNHPTIKYELDWFNSDKAKKFRNKYQLDSTSIPWKYIPKKQQGGFVNPFTNQLAKFIVDSIPENPNPVKVIKRNQPVKVIKENQPVKVISTGNPVKVIKVNQPVTLIKETYRRDNRPKRLDDVSYKNHAKFVEHGGKTT